MKMPVGGYRGSSRKQRRLHCSLENRKMKLLQKEKIQGVLAIRGFEFRGFATGSFLRSTKSPHFAINPSFLELKMLKNGYFFHRNCQIIAN